MSLLRTALGRALLARPVVARAAATRAYCAPTTLAEGAETEEGEFSQHTDAEVAFEVSEPTFMTTLTFSEAGIKAMIDRDIDREKSAAKIIGLLGGRLQTYYVTTTGDANAVIVYTFPKNHDVQTLLYTLMASGSYKQQNTVKLMRWADASQSLRVSRNLYARDGVSCKID